MGRILGIDFGRKRIGLAVTDPLKIIASPLTTVNQAEFEVFIKKYLETEEIESFVVGYPKNLDNTDSECVQYLQPFLNRLKKLFPNIPIHLIDERFTTVMAHKAIIAGGVKKHDRRNKAMVDKVSATIILQSYMASL